MNAPTPSHSALLVAVDQIACDRILLDAFDAPRTQLWQFEVLLASEDLRERFLR